METVSDRRPAQCAGLHRPDFGDVGDEMAQQILDAVAQSRRRGGATRAGALHIEIDHSFLEAAESYIAAVIGDLRPHPGFDQVLDRGDSLGVSGIEKFLAVTLVGAGRKQRRPGHEMLHDGAKDHRLELLPFARAFGDGDEIGTEEHAADAGNAEQPFGERRLRRLFGLAQVKRAAFEHRPAGQEFQGRRVRRRFGLDEHFCYPLSSRVAQIGYRRDSPKSIIIQIYPNTWRIGLEVQGPGPRAQDRTKPTISLTAFMVAPASIRARAAPSASTASIAAGSLRSRFISAPIGPSFCTARSVSAALKVENCALPNCPSTPARVVSASAA